MAKASSDLWTKGPKGSWLGHQYRKITQIPISEECLTCNNVGIIELKPNKSGGISQAVELDRGAQRKTSCVTQQ